MAGQYEPIGQDGAGFTHTFASTGSYLLVVDGMYGEAGPFQLTGTFVGSTTGVADPAGATEMTLVISPNPARRDVVFTGASPGAGTRLSVTDVAGRVVSILDVPTGVGAFKLRWDGVDRSGQPVKAGVYFVRLKSPRQQITRTIVLAP